MRSDANLCRIALLVEQCVKISYTLFVASSIVASLLWHCLVKQLLVHLVRCLVQLAAVVVKQQIMHWPLFHKAELLCRKQCALLILIERNRVARRLLFVEFDQFETECIVDALFPECYGMF